MKQFTEEYYRKTVKQVSRFYISAKLVTSVVAIAVILGVLQANVSYFVKHPFIMTLCTGAGLIFAMFLSTIVSVINGEIEILKKVDMPLMSDWYKDFHSTVEKVSKENNSTISDKDFDELWHRFVLDIINRVYKDKETETDDSD